MTKHPSVIYFTFIMTRPVYQLKDRFNIQLKHRGWICPPLPCAASLLCFHLDISNAQRVIMLPNAEHRGSMTESSGDVRVHVETRRERVTKYGHFCRGGSEENKLQLVDGSHKGLHRGSSSRRKKRRRGNISRGEVMAFCFSRHGYRVRWHPWDQERDISRKSENVMQASKIRRIRSLPDTHPPLLVLLSIHHDHLALGEGQLVRIVGYTVVDGFHSLRPFILRDQTKHTDGFAQVCAAGKENGRMMYSHAIMVHFIFDCFNLSTIWSAITAKL